MADAEASVVVPSWLAKLIGGLFTALVVAGAAWAWQLQQDVSVIKAQVVIENQDIRRRIDRLESILDKLP